jgi:5-methylthioadenosine/S-adenosylhomocysteine deaminase
MLIENGVVVTMNAEREILSGASVVIQGDRIAAVGAKDELRQRYPEAKRLDAGGKMVLPGLINAHTHVAMSIQKGTTLAFSDGLYRIMWPVERSLTAEDVYVGALAGAAETLKGGSTTVVDHYFYADEVARATTAVGVRGVIGHTIMSRLGPIIGEEQFQAGMQFVQDWKGRHPLVIPWLAPHATDTVSKEWLLELRQFANREGVGLHLHVAQSTRERAYVEETYGLSCVKFLEDIGFLGPDVLAAHCIFIDEDEMDILARSGAHPLYCPMGHALNGRPAHAWQMLQKGAGVLIGTDCVTSNNVMDQLGELRIAGASQKQLTGDAQAMPAMKILEMVTVDAAAAIGMQGQLGALEPGYLADVILVDIDGLHTAPNYALIDNLVYCCNGRDVKTVIVNGEIVVEGGRLVKMDEDNLVEQVEKVGRGLIRRAVEKHADLAHLWKD